MSLADKRRLADYVIENAGSVEDLERQVRAVLDAIKAI
jgi:dephospho-CoA kinase